MTDKYISPCGLISYHDNGDGTMSPVPLGSEITSKKGEKAILLQSTRMNEFRYGGRRSGKVFVQWVKDGFKAEYYDNVFDLVVIDPEVENPVPL